MSTPNTLAVPRVGASSHTSMESVVLLPAAAEIMSTFRKV